MRKSPEKLPAWTKLVLAFLLLITLIGLSVTSFLRFEYRTAASKAKLPSLFDYRYCTVNDSNLLGGYESGSLLLLLPQKEYQEGEHVVALHPISEEAANIWDRFDLIQLDIIGTRKYRGFSLSEDQHFVAAAPNAVMGRVVYIVPGWGILYDWIVGRWGFLLFMLLPSVLLAVWIAVMAWMSSKRKRTVGHAEMLPDSPKRPLTKNKLKRREKRLEEPEPFDLFAVVDDPIVPQENSVLPAYPLVASDMTAKKTETASPLDVSVEPEQTANFEPPYLHYDIDPTLDQLRQSIRGREQHKTEVSADMAVETCVSDLDAEWQRCLEQINAFDPDAAIAEIKRKNALYHNESHQ